MLVAWFWPRMSWHYLLQKYKNIEFTFAPFLWVFPEKMLNEIVSGQTHHNTGLCVMAFAIVVFVWVSQLNDLFWGTETFKGRYFEMLYFKRSEGTFVVANQCARPRSNEDRLDPKQNICGDS